MEEQKKPLQNIVSSSTLIPVGFLVIISGFIFWLSSLYGIANTALITAQANQKEIADIRVLYADITDRMARIETKLDILIDRDSK